jgi:hypothetical protein
MHLEDDGGNWLLGPAMSAASALISERSRRGVRVVLLAVLLAIPGQSAQTADVVCGTCDSKIQLTKKQLSCLNQTIARLIEESKSVSPVFFEVTDCASAPVELPSSKLPSDIRVGQSKTGTSSGIFLVLSGAQLQCLSKHISSLCGPTRHNTL